MLTEAAWCHTYMKSCCKEIVNGTEFNIIVLYVCVRVRVLTSSVLLVLFLSGGYSGDCDYPRRKCYSCSVHDQF